MEPHEDKISPLKVEQEDETNQPSPPEAEPENQFQNQLIIDDNYIIKQEPSSPLKQN
jgi:hypothetical protein